MTENSLVGMLLTKNASLKKNSNFEQISNSLKTPTSSNFSSVFQRTVESFPQKSETKFIEIKKDIKKFDEFAKKHEIRSTKDKDKVGTKKVDKNESENEIEKEKKVKENYDLVIDSLAQVLGISTAEVQKLLQEANISKEILASTNTNELVSQISNLLGLDGKQKNDLEENLKKVMINLQKVQIELKDLKDVSDLEKGRTSNEENDNLVQKEIAKISLNQKGTEFKEKIINQEAVITNDKDVLTKNIDKTSIEEISEIKLERNIDERQAEKQAEKTSKVIDSFKTSDNGQSTEQEGSNGQLGFSNKSVFTKTDDTVATNSTNNFQDTLNGIENKTTLNRTTIKNVQAPVPLDKNDVINQIVQKAKLSINGEKSEMILELKPESLGKLSLKIISERGTIVAKMVAENEQVKSLLESNMQSLKDELLKQGVKIEGFSVSVGDEQRQQNHENRKEEFKKVSNLNSNKSKLVAHMGYGITGLGTMSKDLISKARYGFEESSINITA